MAGPSAAPVLPYRFSLPLTENGSSIERHPWKPATRPEEVTLYEIDARAGFDQPAKVITTSIVRGIKGLQQQVQLSGVTPTQLLSAMRQKLVGDGWQTIDSAKWRYDVKAQASLLEINGTRTIDWEGEDDGSKSLSLPGGGFSPPSRRARAADQDQGAPYSNDPEFACHVTTVRLPTATKAPQWSFNTTFDTRIFGRKYYRNFSMRDGTIRMVRGSRTEQLEIDAASAARDNARVASFDNSMAWITFDPTSAASDAQSGRANVPATYEIDWTADDAPCLAAAKQGSVG